MAPNKVPGVPNSGVMMNMLIQKNTVWTTSDKAIRSFSFDFCIFLTKKFKESIFDYVNKSQKENTAKTFLDLAKAVIIAFCIGGLIPGSPIAPSRILWAVFVAIILYVVAMLILGGEDG